MKNYINKTAILTIGVYFSFQFSSTLGFIHHGIENHGFIPNAYAEDSTQYPSLPQAGEDCKPFCSLLENWDSSTCPSSDNSSTNKSLNNFCSLLKNNSMVVNYCETYNAIDNNAASALKLNYVQMSLDLAALTTCATACYLLSNPVTWVTAPQAIYACGALGVAAGTAEFVDTMAMSQTKTAKFVQSQDYVAAATGAAGAITSGAVAAKTATQAIGPQTAKSAKVDKALACGSALLFAASFAARTANVVLMGDLKSNACKNVTNLNSSATTADVAQAGGSGHSIAGNSKSSATGSAKSLSLARHVDQAVECLASSECAATLATQAQQSAASDSNLLTNSQTLKDLTSSIPSNISDLLKTATQSGAGAAISGALGSGGGGGPSMASSLSTFASMAQSEAPQLASELGISMGGAYGRGGGGNGGGRKSGDSGDNPFAALLGGGKEPSALQSKGQLNVFNKKTPTDIWHAGTSSNIFNIISDKIEQIADRVLGK